jgi:hypothetical protein
VFQPDLFASTTLLKVTRERALPVREMDVAAILERLTASCERPRYNFMVLNLLAQACADTGSAGPFVCDGDRRMPVRDWLCDAMTPVARRDPRRLGLAGKVRAELLASGQLPPDPEQAAAVVAAQVQERIRKSGRTNVSRAISELVQVGFVRRHYQGYRVDHRNCGAQRLAVYTVTEEAKRALSRKL